MRHPAVVQSDSGKCEEGSRYTGETTGRVYGVRGKRYGKKSYGYKIRLERQEKKILQLTKQLEEAKDQYEVQLEEHKEEDKKKLFEEYRKSKRSLDEVIDFMKGKADI